MGGDDLAPVSRDAGKGGLHLALKLVELSKVALGVRLERLPARWIGRNEPVTGIRHVELGIRDVVPGMRIDAAVLVSGVLGVVVRGNA